MGRFQGSRMLARIGVIAGLSLIGTGLAAAPSTAAPQGLYVSTSLVTVGSVTVGDYGGPASFTLTNNGTATDTIDLTVDATFTGPAANDYVVTPGPGCPGNGTSTIVLAVGQSCPVDVYFYPDGTSNGEANLIIQGSADTSSTAASTSLAGYGVSGFWEASSAGFVGTSGGAIDYGAVTNTLNKPVVGLASTGNDGGFWLVASDGGIFSFGDAEFYGSTGNLRLNQPIVGMAATPGRKGYWMVASDGGIFSFGDAQFYGSTGALHLNKPVVGMASTPDGQGYWLVASDGGIFSFGDAQFYGSTGNLHLNSPIVGMASTPDGRGYWMVAADGGIFTFGDAGFYGSAAGSTFLRGSPVVGMSAAPDGGGYSVVAANGQDQAFGDAVWLPGGLITNVIGMTSDGGPTLQSLIGIAAIRADYAKGVHPGQVSDSPL